MNKLIEQLQQVAKTKDLSQEAIAREIGVSMITVNRWFNGKYSPTIHVEDKIAQFLLKHQG